VNGSEAVRVGWYRRFVERLDPGERLGELLFGLIMVLTFTLGAGVELAGDRDAARELLIAALGCNAAWGIIDAGLYLMTRLSERGRTLRLAYAIQTAPSVEAALGLVNEALDDRIPSIIRPKIRAALDQEMVERIRRMELPPNRVTKEDMVSAVAVFWLVFLTALPAVVPFLVIKDVGIALRSSNAILIGLLFCVGWRWAAYTRATPWRTGLLVALLGVALVLVAIALGG
jgi:hypothetical protein